MIEKKDVDYLINTIKQALGSIRDDNSDIKRAVITPKHSQSTIQDWLSYSTCHQLRYLKSQSQHVERLTMGSCKTWQYTYNNYEQAKQSIMPLLKKGFTIYTAIMFQSLDDTKDTLWESMHEMEFIIPTIEFIKENNAVTMICNCPIEIATNEPELERYLAKALSGYNHKVSSKFNSKHNDETPNYSGWEHNVNKVLDLIKHSSLKKLILARKTTLDVSDEQAMIQLLTESIKKEPYCNIYFQKSNEQTAFLSITPENLYIRKGNHIQCDAIAGTMPKGSSNHQTEQLARTLLASKKNDIEHQHVVNYLNETLNPLCHCIRQTKTKEVLELAHLQHIHSIIEGTLKKEITDFDLLEKLHPTPATGGFPKKVGLEWIDIFEAFNRGLYAGALGMMRDDMAEFFVGIRSCLMKNKTLHIYTGAGIVQDSKALEEWHELDIKMESYCCMSYDTAYQQ
tara:strand:- start:4836 stop:6197 length:1362 start_codon:yes stop_codon:yes gene_type:complete